MALAIVVAQRASHRNIGGSLGNIAYGVSIRHIWEPAEQLPRPNQITHVSSSPALSSKRMAVFDGR